jgi:hypothetical protein
MYLFIFVAKIQVRKQHLLRPKADFECERRTGAVDNLAALPGTRQAQLGGPLAATQPSEVLFKTRGAQTASPSGNLSHEVAGEKCGFEKRLIKTRLGGCQGPSYQRGKGWETDRKQPEPQERRFV